MNMREYITEDVTRNLRHLLDNGFTWTEEDLAQITPNLDDIDITKEGGRKYDLLAYVTQQYINAGVPLPAPIGEFVMGVLEGRIGRKQKGPRPRALDIQNDDRDLAILLAIHETLKISKAMNKPIPATRNDKYQADERPSACDAVSTCLWEDLDYKLGYKGVEKIWTSQKGRLFRQIFNAE